MSRELAEKLQPEENIESVRYIVPCRLRAVLKKIAWVKN
jgi:hypothetical protein